LFFGTDKAKGGKRFSMWRRASPGLNYGSKYGGDWVTDSVWKAGAVCDLPSMDDNFFSYRNKRGTMTMILRKGADRIKDLAMRCGLPPSSFSTHAGRRAFRTQQKHIEPG